MSLPRIQSPEPITISELPTEYSDLFISDFRIRSPIPDAAIRLDAVFRPFNYDSGVFQPDGTPQELAVDLRAKAAEYPATVGQALGSVMQISAWLLRESQLLAIENRTTEQQTELDTIQASLTGS